MDSKDFRRAIFLVALIAVMILVGNKTGVTAQEGGEEGRGPSEPEQTLEERAVTVPGWPGLISVHPSAFEKRSTTGNLVFHNYYEIYNSSATESLVVAAPVYLPQGAKVNKVTMYYYDTNSEGYVRAYLTRVPLGGGLAGFQDLASLVSDTNTGYANFSDNIIAYETIDNATYSYLIDLYFSYPAATTSLRVTGFRIDYEYPSYLPTVMN